jgi:hypothetical protein
MKYFLFLSGKGVCEKVAAACQRPRALALRGAAL